MLYNSQPYDKESSLHTFVQTNPKATQTRGSYE
jgi:hypothetical protein